MKNNGMKIKTLQYMIDARKGLGYIISEGLKFSEEKWFKGLLRCAGTLDVSIILLKKEVKKDETK